MRRKPEKKRKRKVEEGCLAGVDTSGMYVCLYICIMPCILCVCVCVYVCQGLFVCTCTPVYKEYTRVLFTCVYKFNTIVVIVYVSLCILLQLIVDTAINVPGC